MTYLRVFRGRTALWIAALWLAVAIAGCAMPFKETRFVRVQRNDSPSSQSRLKMQVSEAKPDSETPSSDGSSNLSMDKYNYYKVTVSGFSFLSSARYLSGYFDENAVNQYFSEFKQDPKGHFPSLGSGTTATESDGAKDDNGASQGAGAAADTEEAKGEAVDPATGQVIPGTFVMILSSNSDEIAKQIASVAESQDMAETFIQLANGGKYKAASEATVLVATQKKIGEKLAAEGDKFTAADFQPTAEQLLAYANDLAFAMGNTKPFASLAEAAEWIKSK